MWVNFKNIGTDMTEIGKKYFYDVSCALSNETQYDNIFA